ncbi:MAG: metallophosphoesterase family protein [Eubacteriaceae bacterium]
MKIGIISDSHGNIKNIKKAVNQLGEVDYIFHLGDNVIDALKIKEMVNYPVRYVKGNTDYTKDIEDLIVDIGNKRFLLTHGHKYGIKNSLQRLYYKAVENEIDVVLFGHSHIPYYEEIEGVMFINPGSIGDKRWQPKETYVLLEIIHNEIKVKFNDI